MRRRLVAAFVGLTLAVIALYAVPRAVYLRDEIDRQQQELLEHNAQATVATVRALLADEEPVTDEALGRALSKGQRAEYAGADGTRLAFPADVRVDAGDRAVTRRLPDGARVTVTLDEDVVHDEVRRALVPLGVVGALLVPLAAGAGVLLARRLSRPFDELARTARQIGTGQLAIDVPHYPIAEAEEIGRALEESAGRLDAMIRREREVATHASHQLRTPLTALRLTLEDLALWPETAPSVAEELHRITGEVDRFAQAVAELLEQARTGRMQEAEDLDVARILEDAVERWRPVAAAVGLRVDARACAQAQARLHRGTVVQAVDLLLQHACEVSSGTIHAACRDRGSHLAVEVAFPQRRPDWHGDAAADARKEAADLAAALGGHLLEEPPADADVDAVLALVLPSADASRTVS